MVSLWDAILVRAMLMSSIVIAARPENLWVIFDS